MSHNVNQKDPREQLLDSAPLPQFPYVPNVAPVAEQATDTSLAQGAGSDADKRANTQGMADCMDMVRQELIEAGIIDASIAPMFVANAVLAHIARLARTAVPSDSVKQRLSELEDLVGSKQITATELFTQMRWLVTGRTAAPEDGGLGDALDAEMQAPSEGQAIPTLKFPATRVVNTPSGPVPCCDDHAAQLTGLFGFLGASVVHTAPEPGMQCANCENEAKPKGGAA